MSPLKTNEKIYSRKAIEDIKKNQMGSLELQEKQNNLNKLNEIIFAFFQCNA